MAQKVLIMGESGTGKSTSLEDEPTGDVYSRYQVFCADCGMQPMSNIVFSKQINKRLGFETVVTKVGGKSIRIFRKV